MSEPPELINLRRTRPSRRTYVLLALCLVVVAGLVSIAPFRAWYRNHPHGNPDPGGRRLAALATVAHDALPSEATSMHLILTKSSWGHGGCDGGAPGWTNMEAIETFRAAINVVPEVDARMNALHWRVVSELSPTAPTSSYPPAAVLGTDAPYAREYEPSPDVHVQVAWLFTPAQTGKSFWELDLEVAPAEVPDHNC